MTSIFQKTTAWFSTQASEADFESVYRTEMPRIYNFFRYRFGDDFLAEDLTSETFEKAWKYREKYKRDLSAFSTWLFTIAKRVSIDHYRRRHFETSLEETNDLPDNVVNVEEMTQSHDDFERLSSLLARLSDRDRELVALKYGAGLTNRSIAHLSGLNESNVAVILHRAVTKLRTEWEMP